MNQRLLERLKRHGEFPQLRPTAVAPRQRGSVEPFSPSQPRLALAQQSVANAQPLSSSQPLEAGLPTGSNGFSATEFSQFPQATQLETPSDAAQVDSVALEDFEAAGRFGASESDFTEFTLADSNFTESPFSLNAQTVPTINPEATITAPLNAVLSAAAIPAPSANPTVTPSARQLEQALTARNPQSDTEPRIASQNPAQQGASAQPIAVAMTNAFGPQTSSLAVNTDAATSVEPRAADYVPSQSLGTQEDPQFGVDNANLSALQAVAVSPAGTSPNAFSPQASSQIDPEFASAAAAPDFDRRAAMLELRELGVKVRVTLSNAALKAQLEAARPPAPLAPSAAIKSEILPSDEERSTAPGNLETRVGANVSLNSDAPQMQPDQSALGAQPDQSALGAQPDQSALGAQPSQNADAPRVSSAPSNSATPAATGADTVKSAALERTSLESPSQSRAADQAQPRSASLDAFSAVPATPAVDATVASSQTQSPTFDNIASLEVNQTLELTAGNGSEPAVYGTVAAVEVYNPPNRRAAITRPKAAQAPQTEAEVMFASLPDSNPLEWLTRLNSVQALDGGSSSALNLANQVALPPAQSNPVQIGAASGSSPVIPAQLGTAPLGAALPDITRPSPAQSQAAATSAARTGAPLLPNLETSVSPSVPRPETTPSLIAQSAALVAAPGAPQRGSLSSPALVAPQGVAGTAQSASASPSTATATTSNLTGSTPATVQRQAASDGNPSETTSDSALERTTGRFTNLDANGFEVAATEINANRVNATSANLEADPLEVAPSQTGGVRGSAASELGEANGLEITGVQMAGTVTSASGNDNPLETGVIVQDSAIRNASDSSNDRATEVSQALEAAPRDPLDSSRAEPSLLTSSGLPPIAVPSSLAQPDSGATLIASNASSPASAGISPSAATVQQPNAALRSDSGSQGTVAGVEVYNPPNRRAAITRPKAAQAPQTEAEVMFASLPDSNPLEWLTRLNSVQALDGGSSSAPVFAQNGVPGAADALQTAPLAAGELGLRAEPRFNAALDVQTTNPTAQSTALIAPRATQAAPELIARTEATTSPQRGSEPQIREASSAASNPQALTPIGGPQSSAPLIATPPNATLNAATLIAGLPLSAESPARSVQPVRLSSSAQRLIAPITGIDPNTVQIRRDEESDALTKMYRADALTVNGTVLLSARLGAETPETLGVIAHELTHVARERSPRFVPPALMSANRTASFEGQGEESIALQIEGFTRALAQQGMAISSAPMGSPANPASAPGKPGKSRSLESVPWGNGVLPAPWELADRLEALTNPGSAAAQRPNAQSAFQPSAAPQAAYNSAFTRSEAPSFASSSSSSSAPAAPSGGGNFAGIGNTNAPVSVRAADQGRNVPTSNASSNNVQTPSPEGPLPQSPKAAPKAASGSAPTPDLDDLARQVYAVLKRRLLTERRRSS